MTARLLTHEGGDRLKYGLPDDLPQDFTQGHALSRNNDKLYQSSNTEKSTVIYIYIYIYIYILVFKY